MTDIKIQEEKENHVFEIKGHAGYAESGADIVCAAISVLGYTLLNELSILEARGLVEDVEHEEESGYMKISFKGEGKEVETVCETINTGFLMLEENFFQFLRVNGEK